MSFLVNIWRDAMDGFPETRKVYEMIAGRVRRGYPLKDALILTVEEMSRAVDDGIEELEALIDENEANLAECNLVDGPIRRRLEGEIAKAKIEINRIKEECT